MMMRAFVQEHDLVGCEVSFCKGCHEQFSEQILANYKGHRIVIDAKMRKLLKKELGEFDICL